ncbi:FtsX-like permease family protein [Candidatus Peregrinibacteria bacterium]|nr:FtsX-like permease family protein [Candidatus Peregrinibacteria bacterium]
MNSLLLKRSLLEFTKTLWRNRWITMGTVISMALVFFLTWMVLSLGDSSQRIVDRVEKKVDIGVFFQQDVPSFQIEGFLTELERMKEDGKIQKYEFFSKERALEQMKEKYPEKVRFLERYKFKNPLQDSVEIVPGSMGSDEIFAFLEDDRFKTVVDYEFFDTYQQKKEEVNRILHLLSFSRSGGVFLVFVFSGILIFLIAYFVTSILSQKKKEIFIMRLVGASHAFIRLPFILEGITLSLLAFLISYVMFDVFINLVAPTAIHFFPSSSDQIFMGTLIFETQDYFHGMFFIALLSLFITSGIIAFIRVERFISKRHLLASD